jgi:hypothetical protein
LCLGSRALRPGPLILGCCVLTGSLLLISQADGGVQKRALARGSIKRCDADDCIPVGRALGRDVTPGGQTRGWEREGQPEGTSERAS